MNNGALKEFAKMMAEELKKTKENSSTPSLNEQIQNYVEKTNIPIEVSKYLSAPKIIKEDIKSEHDKLVNISNNSDNIPAQPANIEAQRWNDPLRPLDQKFVTAKEMNDHYGLFLQRIQQQMSTIGGGGEVKFRYLDDFNRATMTTSNDNWVLEYDAASGKVQFTDEIGPIQIISFDTTHDVSTHAHSVGSVCWNNDDQTINIFHPNGVTQQVGQETHAYVRNGTANTITNGTPVMFSGADEAEFGARLLVSPMVADGSFPSLYGVGIATQDLDPNQDGRVTVWGKVRDLDTSIWEIGDILYADPNNAGGLTNVKPTAPNNVIPFAAVLKKDATAGEIFVRPTIEQQKYYGRFSRTTDQIGADINTAYAVQFNETNISNGITFNGPGDTQILVPDSGFYQFDFSAQVTASSNKGVAYIWFRKNGEDILGSTRSTTVTNGDTFNMAVNISLSLNADDYIEVMWAHSAAGIFLNALAATAFSPASVAASLKVVQVQL